jgi:riboflavin synthase
MFTGLVETTGTLARRTASGPDARLVVRAAFGGGPVVLGESIAIDGVCLTVDAMSGDLYEFDASSETLEKTTLGSLAIGARVNLERAVPLGGRMGGHIVSGHVDGVGKVVSVTPVGGARKVVFEAPAELAKYIAAKGSIAVAGVSLTVNNVQDACFDVVLIPHTQQKTSLDGLGPGAKVNLEVDVLARYVARLMACATRADEEREGDASLLDKLKKSGYV